ncbi:MAG: HEAT repeat domain-containing protein [Methanobacteriaceae archaeon]
MSSSNSKLDDNKLQTIIGNLKNSNIEIRKEALDRMAEIKDKRIIKPLISVLDDDNHQVRFKAANILGGMGKDAVEPLIQALKQGEGESKRFVTFALKKIGDASVVDHLIQALDDEDWGVRKVAARSLGEFGDKRAVEPLFKSLNDDDWGVQLAAVRSLGDLGDERAVDPIKKARRKGDKDFKKAANKALKKIGKK